MDLQESSNLLERAKGFILDLTVKLEETETALIKAENKLTTFNKMTDQSEWFDMKEVAKILNYAGFGRNKIYGMLRKAEILNDDNEPYQVHVSNGRFCVKVTTKEDQNGILRVFKVTLVSAKGMDYIRELLEVLTNE